MSPGIQFIQGFASALNPFEWSTTMYLVVIAVLLLLHQLVPRGGAWFVRLGREILLIAPAIFVYFAVRGLVVARDEIAFTNADSIIRFQTRLGLFHEPTLQAWILGSDFLVRLVNWIYIWGHWPVVVGTLVWLIIRRPETFSIYRNAFLISGIIAMFIFATYPVAPPRLVGDLDVVDTVTEQSNSYRVLQPPALTNPYAAMPSLHFGWNLLMGIALIRESRTRPMRLFGYAMPVMMFIGIVFTANHYFVDGVVGGLLVAASLWISIILLRTRGFDLWPGWSVKVTSDPPNAGGVPSAEYPPEQTHPLLSMETPVTVAHRAGNDLARARAAADAGVDVIEADLWLHRGRLEVRHSKTLGQLPLRWDRWWIRFRPEPDLDLETLLKSIPDEVVVMLDLKGRDPELPARLLDVSRRVRPGRGVLVCSQTWPLLENLRGEPDVSLVYSIGNGRQLARALPMLEQAGYDAVSIHNELLTPETVRELRARVPAIITWPINDRSAYRRVQELGVTGVISDSLDLLREIESGKPAGRETESLAGVT